MNTARISVLVLLLGLVLAVAVGVVIVIIYKRKVNNALKEEKSNAHMRIPAPADTMNIVVKVIVIALLIWIAFSLRTISDLRQDIANMQSGTASQIMSLSNEINILRTELAQVNNKVMQYNSEVISVDATHDTCTVRHTLQLKSYADDTTVILRTGNGEEIPLTHKGAGIFEADAKTDMFAQMMEPTTVAIKEDGKNYVEEVSRYFGDVVSYYQLVIPLLNAGYNNVMYDDGTVSIADIVLYPEYKQTYTITSAKVVVEQNEKEIDSIDVTKVVKDCLETFYGDVRIPLNKLYNVAAKDTFKVTLCITTPDGYTLKQVITEKNAENRHTSFGNTFQIFDQNGYLKVNAYPMY